MGALPSFPARDCWTVVRSENTPNPHISTSHCDAGGTQIVHFSNRVGKAIADTGQRKSGIDDVRAVGITQEELLRRNQSNWTRAGRWFVGATFLIAFAASVLLLSGCGDSPVAPTIGDGSVGALQQVEQEHGALLAQDSIGATPKLLGNLLRNVFFALESLLIGEDGGLLSLELGGKTATFAVPVGALDENALIVMKAVQAPTPMGEATVFDFGPDGLEFLSPATLSLETARAEGSLLRLYWWNNSVGRWELQESCVVKDGSVHFSVHHFSKYGIS